MKNIPLTLFLMLFVLSIVSASPITPTVNTTGTWYDLNDIIINNNGTPFWDQHSHDSPELNHNIGNFLTKTGAFSSAATSPDLDPNNVRYLAASDKDYPASFYFSGPPDSNFKMLIEVAGMAGSNVLGWYDTTTSVKTPIFVGSDGTGGYPVSKTVSIGSEQWGFYLTNGDGKTYYSEAKDSNYSFALFAVPDEAIPTDYYLGIEDKPKGDYKDCTEKYGDFQDMVITFRPLRDEGGSDVPEPATFSLIGLGLLAAAIKSRKR